MQITKILLTFNNVMVVNIAWLFCVANTTEKDFLMNGAQTISLSTEIL